MATESYIIPVYVKTLSGEIIQLSVDRYLRRQGVHDALCRAYPDEFPYDLTHVTAIDTESEIKGDPFLEAEMTFLVVVEKDTLCRLTSVETRPLVRHWTFTTSADRVYHIYRVIHRMDCGYVQGMVTSLNGPFSVTPYAYYAMSEDEPLSEEDLQTAYFYHKRVSELFYNLLLDSDSDPSQITFHDAYAMQLIVNQYEKDIGNVRLPTQSFTGRVIFSFCECGHLHNAVHGYLHDITHHHKTTAHVIGHPSNRAFIARAKAYAEKLTCVQ